MSCVRLWSLNLTTHYFMCIPCFFTFVPAPFFTWNATCWDFCLWKSLYSLSLGHKICLDDPNSSNWKSLFLYWIIAICLFVFHSAGSIYYILHHFFFYGTLPFNKMWETWDQTLYFTCLSGLCEVWHCALESVC